MRLQVKIDKTSKSGTRYSPYAAIFAPDDEAVCKDESCTDEQEVTYSVQEGTTFSTYGEPDPDHVFLVKFVGKGAIDQTMSMTWNEAGLLSSASSTVTNRTGDVVLSALKLAAGLGAKAALGAGEVKLTDEKLCVPAAPSDRWILRTLRQAGSSSATLMANYCAIKEEDRKKFPANESDSQPGSIRPATAGDVLTEAVNAYVNNVAPLITARLKILTGTSQALDGGSLLSHIEAEIKQQLVVLYLGSKKTLTWDGPLDVRMLGTGAPLTVIRINPTKGVCIVGGEIPHDAKSFPDKFNILSGYDCERAQPINLTINYFPSPSDQLFTRISDITQGERSFRYRIPAQVQAALCDEVERNTCVKKEKSKIYGSGQFFVAQLGTIVSLPASRHSKSLSYDLAFIENTGGLKTFKLGTTGALESGTIDALTGIGGTIIDARNKNADDLNRLTKQDQLLKLQDEICTIQKKYGLPCTVQPH